MVMVMVDDEGEEGRVAHLVTIETFECRWYK